MYRFAVVSLCIAVAVSAGGLVEPVAAGSIRFSPPVDAPVLDPFRLPEGPYGPGNRGIEYDTGDGVIVRAASDGVVAFAGPVVGSLFISVDHPGGLRTTYGYVGRVLQRPGTRVRRGDPVAVTAGPFHFTVRLHGVYIDPASLYGRVRTTVRLVPLRSDGIPVFTAGLRDLPDTLLDGSFGPRTTPPRDRRTHWVRATPGRLGVPHEHATGKEENPWQSSP